MPVEQQHLVVGAGGSIVVRLADSGVSMITRLPTAITGDAAGRTNAAANSPTPTRPPP